MAKQVCVGAYAPTHTCFALFYEFGERTTKALAIMV